MVYKFRLLSSEQDDFIRDFEVRSDHTFYELHVAIQKNCRYDTSQIASFFLCNSEWEKEHEITLFELSEEPDKDSLVMDNAIFSQHITGLKQRLLYVFDIFNERAFFIELVEIRDEVPSKSYPVCTLSQGSPPVQILMDEVFLRQNLTEQMDDLGIDYVNDFDDSIFDDSDINNSIPGDNEPDEK
jgi:hypothetical protein